MNNIHYRWMDPSEVTKVRDIDRSEVIRTGYKLNAGELQKMEVNWDAPLWGSEGDGEFTVAAQIQFCQEHLDRNGRLYGAFDNEKLVGVGLIQPEIRAGIAQLAYLHVSNHYRKKGIAGEITNALIREAKNGGAQKMYVSATPSGSAVGFYLGRGFEPVDTPIPELFEQEPDDIHMLMDI